MRPRFCFLSLVRRTREHCWDMFIETIRGPDQIVQNCRADLNGTQIHFFGDLVTVRRRPRASFGDTLCVRIFDNSTIWKILHLNNTGNNTDFYLPIFGRLDGLKLPDISFLPNHERNFLGSWHMSCQFFSEGMSVCRETRPRWQLIAFQIADIPGP
jgi:hypothetical protein